MSDSLTIGVILTWNNAKNNHDPLGSCNQDGVSPNHFPCPCIHHISIRDSNDTTTPVKITTTIEIFLNPLEQTTQTQNAGAVLLSAEISQVPLKRFVEKCITLNYNFTKFANFFTPSDTSKHPYNNNFRWPNLQLIAMYEFQRQSFHKHQTFDQFIFEDAITTNPPHLLHYAAATNDIIFAAAIISQYTSQKPLRRISYIPFSKEIATQTDH